MFIIKKTPVFIHIFVPEYSSSFPSFTKIHNHYKHRFEGVKESHFNIIKKQVIIVTENLFVL